MTRIFSGPAINPRWVKSDLTTGRSGPITRARAGRQAAERPRADPQPPTRPSSRPGPSRRRWSGRGSPWWGCRNGCAPRPARRELAAVQSATIEQLVDYTLTVSDNTEAEVLARLGALAGHHAGSFAGAATQNVRVAAAARRTGCRHPAVRRQRTGPDRPHPGAEPSPTWSAKVAGLAAAATCGRCSPACRSRASPGRWPRGTSTSRPAPGPGWSGPRPGTLSGVNALAGVVVDADGRLLAFAFMASRPTPKTPPAARPLHRPRRPRSWPAAAAADGSEPADVVRLAP